MNPIRTTTVNLLSECAVLNPACIEEALYDQSKTMNHNRCWDYDSVQRTYHFLCSNLVFALKYLEPNQIQYCQGVLERHVTNGSLKDLFGQKPCDWFPDLYPYTRIDNVDPPELPSVKGFEDCKKCKHYGRVADNTTYYQKQTRSADEPITTFYTCLTCGNKWKS